MKVEALKNTIMQVINKGWWTKIYIPIYKHENDCDLETTVK